MHPITYIKAIKGTNTLQTLAIHFTPPIITRPTRNAITIPVMYGDTEKLSLINVEIDFAWLIFPIPNAAKAVAIQKNTANQCLCITLSSTTIGPPNILPLSVLILYFTDNRDSEYLVAIPSTPVSQHQNTAPGPPAAIAIPTPIIFPVPIVAAKATINAPN